MEALAKVNATRIGAIPNGTLPDSLLPAPQPAFLYTAAGHRAPAIPMQDLAAFAARFKCPERAAFHPSLRDLIRELNLYVLAR